MDNELFNSYLIDDRSHLSFIKREIHNLIKSSFDEIRTGEIDIVVSELCSNLIKYAARGELLYRIVNCGEVPVFEILCLDNGPGMKDVGHFLQDGISSANTLGHGLGSITRLSNVCQIYSQPSWGTIVYCRFQQAKRSKKNNEKFIVRNINVAKPGEKVSGDGMALRVFEEKAIIFAGDGLGHGPHAKEAVDKAIAVFEQTTSCDPSEIIREMHAGIKRSRGLVGTVALLDLDKKKWEICGIGNILARLQRGLEFRNYISHNGIISLNIPGRLENAEWEMEKFQMMIFCSDGIKTRWDLLRYPSILKFDPIIIAAAIYKDHARKTDDMSILIVKVT